jgi:hypothetical protein
MPVLDVVAAADAVKKADGLLGIVAKHLATLKAQPDPAAMKLAEVLDEIAKTWQVVDSAMATVISLGVDPDALARGSLDLLKIEGGGLLTSVQRGRGHCHVIETIYTRLLDRWFSRVFGAADLREMRNVFEQLASADYDTFAVMERVASQLQDEATAMLDDVTKGHAGSAAARGLGLRAELHPLRLQMSQSLTQMMKLRSEFVAMTDAL